MDDAGQSSTIHNYIPNWINSDYFLPILKRHETEFSRILEFSKERATIPGENYCSIMIRVLMKVLLKGNLENQKN